MPAPLDHVEVLSIFGATCAWCSIVSTEKSPLSACTACNLVSYCSRECQKKHYKIHKKLCKAFGGAAKEFNINNTNTNANSSNPGFIGIPKGPSGAIIGDAIDSNEIHRRSLEYSAECEAIVRNFEASQGGPQGANRHVLRLSDLDSELKLRRKCTVCRRLTGPKSEVTGDNLCCCGICHMSFFCVDCGEEKHKACHTNEACDRLVKFREYSISVAVAHEHPPFVIEGRSPGIDLATLGSKCTFVKDSKDNEESKEQKENGAIFRDIVNWTETDNLLDTFVGVSLEAWRTLTKERIKTGADVDPVVLEADGLAFLVISSMRQSYACTVPWSAQAGLLGNTLARRLSPVKQPIDENIFEENSNDNGNSGTDEPFGPEYNFVIHIVGPTMHTEGGQVSMWEEIQHLCPMIKRLSIILIGPDVFDIAGTDDERDDDLGDDGIAPGYDNQMCPKCTSEPETTLHIEYYRLKYREYAKHRKFTNPNLIAFFNSGVSNESASIQAWGEDISAALGTKAPILLTANDPNRARAMKSVVSQIATDNHPERTDAIGKIHVNPFHATISFPDSVSAKDGREGFTVPNAFVMCVE